MRPDRHLYVRRARLWARAIWQVAWVWFWVVIGIVGLASCVAMTFGGLVALGLVVL